MFLCYSPNTVCQYVSCICIVHTPAVFEKTNSLSLPHFSKQNCKTCSLPDCYSEYQLAPSNSIMVLDDVCAARPECILQSLHRWLQGWLEVESTWNMPRKLFRIDAWLQSPIFQVTRWNSETEMDKPFKFKNNWPTSHYDIFLSVTVSLEIAKGQVITWNRELEWSYDLELQAELLELTTFWLQLSQQVRFLYLGKQETHTFRFIGACF